MIATTINTQPIAAPYTAQAETYRCEMNASIAANWSSYADDYDDFAAIPKA